MMNRKVVAKVPRLMFSAISSGAGKTLISCGFLNLLKRRGMKAAAFKSGPDYIDPLFHTEVLKTRSRNLDTFFFDDNTVRMLLCENAKEADISVIEGGMGFYDGLASDRTKASAYELSKVTGTPVILIVDASASSLSVAAVVKGFSTFRDDAYICGVILNGTKKMHYMALKEQIEKETGVRAVGYLPPLDDIELKSRHLGLTLPMEYDDLQKKLDTVSEIMEESLDVAAILSMAETACTVSYEKALQAHSSSVRIGVARDEAFCFIYEDNLRLLENLGTEIVPFSVLHDQSLPEGLSGLMLFGGYPELHAEALSGNISMKEDIQRAFKDGLPIYAECGGFMYLQEELFDMEDHPWPMTGILKGSARNEKKLTRFGYVTLKKGRMFGRDVGDIPAHEFHYYNSTDNGDAFTAEKPSGKRSWQCAVSNEHIYAGFPHIHFYSNKKVAEAFISACAAYKKRGL